MKKTIITSSALIALCASGFALADHPMQSPSPEKMEMHMMMPKNHEAIKKAVEANDFAAFQVATQDSPMAVVDTQTEFDQVVAMHIKMRSMQDEMKALHTSFGIEMKKPEDGEKMKSHRSNHEAFQKAIEANDFAAFQSAVMGTPMALIDQAKFDQVVAMHSKMKALKAEKEALHATLGIVKPEMHKMKDMKKEGKMQNHSMKKSEMKTPKLNLKKATQKDLKVAILSGTYEEFLASLPEGHVLATKITKENFAQLKALADAKKAGDTTKVKEILKAIGVTNKEKTLLKRIVR